MRSVFVGGVDFAAKPEELQAHFASCGTMDRVTILCDKYTGHPKGCAAHRSLWPPLTAPHRTWLTFLTAPVLCSYAYIEFAEVESIELALKFNDTEFKGRPLKVTEKRKNVPGRGRGRGGRGRGGRGFRGRGRRGGRGFRAPRYHPYGGGY